jgi:hypothetical protein
VEKTTVSIVPLSNADAAIKTRLNAFKRNITKFADEDLMHIIQEANTVMGIRTNSDNTDPSLCAFSLHRLSIEICGPEQEHFTVIDVPGIFRVPSPASPPFTTDRDVNLVRNMVEHYIRNSQSIILAVIPSNIDISTQEIVKMAERADPSGAGTMGVLTKPDLVTETSMQKAVKDLILGKGKQLRLGYCVVKNRGADDAESTVSDRLSQEKIFFENTDWREVAGSGRCGIGSLKTRLSDILLSITKKEFPYVKRDVLRQLRQRQFELENMGLPRAEHSAQRSYFGKLGSRFQQVTQCALNGYYDSEATFTEAPGLKLITAVTKINERFADTFWKKAHKRHTSSDWSDEGEAHHDPAEIEDDFTINLSQLYPELHGIIAIDRYECPQPETFNNDSIMSHIENVYRSNRGPELGTFSGFILSATFREQSEKWEWLVLAHISTAIGLVHHYISSLLTRICPDERVRTQLWETFLVDELRRAYVRAMAQAHFLLRIEREIKPSTYNHYLIRKYRREDRKTLKR